MKRFTLRNFFASVGDRLATRHQPAPQKRRSFASTSVAALLTFSGGVVAEAIAPAAVHAYTSRLAVTLTAEPGESFETLLRRAETVARAAAQRSFDRDILITDVAIVISAEYQSRIAPILTLEATRNQWKSRPDARRWATYYRNSKVLLGLGDTTATPTVSPGVVANPASNPVNRAPNSGGTPGGVPASTNAQPSAAESPPAAPQQPTGGATTSPTDEASTTGSPGRTQIIPDRIPTPAGIGK